MEFFNTLNGIVIPFIELRNTIKRFLYIKLEKIYWSAEMPIGKNILQRCKELNLSVKELSILSKVPQTTLHNIVSGKSEPKIGSIKKIAIALHTTADKLLFDEDDINSEDELRILFIEIAKMPIVEQQSVKEMIRALIIQSKTRELAFRHEEK